MGEVGPISRVRTAGLRRPGTGTAADLAVHRREGGEVNANVNAMSQAGAKSLAGEEPPARGKPSKTWTFMRVRAITPPRVRSRLQSLAERESTMVGSGMRVLVTGASSGIGLVTCVELARRGHRVVASMRDSERSGSLRAAVQAAGIAERVEVAILDVAAPAAMVEQSVERIAAAAGGIDASVNNAGTAYIAPAERLTDSEWRRTFDTNLFGAMACIRAVLPRMRNRGSGTIVHISSINGRVPAEGGAAYTASKFALEGLSETLRLELQSFGIRVVIVQPGQYATNMWKVGFLEQDDEPAYATICQEWQSLGGAPPPGAGDPAEVGALVADILVDPSPALRYPVGPVGAMTAAELIERHLSGA